MRGKSLIVGATLLFAPVGCGTTPTVGEPCDSADRDCQDRVAYYCEDGEWKSMELGPSFTCDCWLNGESSGCAVIGYIGVTKSDRSEVRTPDAPTVRRLRRGRRASIAA